jgi:acyl carrier protein
MPAETHVEHTPIGPDEVLGLVRERLAAILEIDEDRITLDARFVEDLEADSLALIELVEELEEELG